MKARIFQLLSILALCAGANAQVNSGSTGIDGAFNPTVNTTINMADHPTGVYNYTSVNIPSGVAVKFTPNFNNTPVTWLVQGDVTINGGVDVSAFYLGNVNYGMPGGPGGGAGGNPLPNSSAGQGPGGSPSYALGGAGGAGYAYDPNTAGPSGKAYGNIYIMPLQGGSGGGGSSYYTGAVPYSPGGGGGGAILIAATGQITLNGAILANGSNGYGWGGSGSGGAIRLVATKVSGIGTMNAIGGSFGGSNGRIRVDSYLYNYLGTTTGSFTRGSQFVIIPGSGQNTQGGQNAYLTIASMSGVPVSASPGGLLTAPDAVLSPQQNNPVNVVVNCTNLPLNTLITVTVIPSPNGSPVSATGYNTTGSLVSSTATIPIVMPRGGGQVYATAATSN